MVHLQFVWEGVTLTLTLTVLSVITTIISISPSHGERWAGAGTLRHQLAASCHTLLGNVENARATLF